jgi:hypothetical protein
MITQPLQSSIAANESVTFTVTPKGGLFPGTYTSDIWVTGDNGVSTSFTVRFTVSAKIIPPIDPQPNPDPVEPPNPPEPEPSPDPTPDPNNDTIMVNGQPVEIEPGEDGALRITFTEEDIQQFEDSGGEYNIVIEDHVNIRIQRIPVLRCFGGRLVYEGG